MMHPVQSTLLPPNEAERLKALRRYHLLDKPAEAAFDRIARLMADCFNTQIALVSLVDEQTVYFKGNEGMPGVQETPRGVSLCSYAILSPEPTIFDKPLSEPCLLSNPLVHGEFGLRFYAGAPLTTKEGHRIGSVCVVDREERTFSPKEMQMLQRFAELAMHEIEVRDAMQKQREMEELLYDTNRELRFVTDTMPQLVWATEPDGYASYFNKMWTEYTGLPFEALTGDGWTQVLHPGDRQRSLEAWQEAVRKGASYDVEYRVRSADGAYRWFIARGTPMRNEQGEVLRWYGTTTDIEEQKMAEVELEKKVQERARQLNEAQQSLQAIVDQAPIGMMVYESLRDEAGLIKDFRMLYYNARGNELTGVSIEERDSLGLKGLLAHYKLEDQFSLYVQMMEDRKPMAWQQYIESTGKWLWVTVTPLNDGFLRTLSDITELKQSQQQLKQQSEFANSVLDSSINAVMALDAIHDSSGAITDFRIVKINKAFTIITGLDERVVGGYYRTFFPNTESSGVFQLYRDVLLTGRPDRKEIYSTDQDLNSWFDLSVVKRGENGIVVSFNNISPQRKAAIRIEAQKKMLDNILRHSPSGITVTEMVRDEEGNIIDGRTIIANETSEKHSGMPRELALSRSLSETLPGVMESPLFKQALETLRTGEPFITQYHVELTGRWIELAVAKMDEDRLINVFTDVTPMKEAQLRQDQLLEDLKRSNEELEQFTYVSHHDLQEPLRKIMMLTDMVKNDAQTQLSESSAARLEKVSSATRRMSAALRDVLNYASLNKPEDFAEVDLDEILRAVLSDLELAIQEKGARISAKSLPSIQGIPHQMHQLLYNLVNNALKFAAPGCQPELEITCRLLTNEEVAQNPELNQQREYFELRFHDNGIGFNPEWAEKIFVMFQRLHTRESYAGTGIGLALCRKVVHNHGGLIWADSKPGEGATFHVVLPGPLP